MTSGKPKKRPLKPADIEAQHPFHWGFEFDEILNTRGGFDAIITNPPWETFKPYAKEFFERTLRPGLQEEHDDSRLREGADETL